MVQRKFAVSLLAVIASALVAACGGGGGGGAGTTSHTISGTVTGLSGTGLVLQDNGGDNLTIGASGNFTFKTAVANGNGYQVAVLAQPSGPAQTCTVNNGAGTISGADITNVAVVCSTNTYTVSGTVSGLAGTGLVLQDNNGSNLTVAANGAFTFATPVASGANYNVTVLTQPTGPAQTCTVNGGTGLVASANVTGVTVTCSTNAYAISGTVTGLSGAGLVLQNNGGDNLAVSASGTFTFATPVVPGTAYNVTVFTQPSTPLQRCTVASGTGTMGNAAVTNVAISCVNAYTIGGTVTGLVGTGLVLQDNGGDFLNIAANGKFTFATSMLTGNSYNVAVNTQPTGPAQVCSVSGGLGTVANANVSVAVNCIIPVPRYVISVNGDNSVSTYVVDASTGRLKYISKAAAGTWPMAATVDPSGKYAYVANAVSNTVSQYTIGANGVLTPMTPATLPTGTKPQAVAVAPSGRYVYVVNSMSSDVSAYSIDSATGALTQISCSLTGAGGCSATPANFATGGGPTGITFASGGQYAYVANSGGTVSQYTVGANGALVPMAVPSVAAGTSPLAIVVDPSGKYAYVGNSGGTVSQYAIGANGSLSPMAVPSVTAPGVAGSLAVEPNGKYLYVASNGVSQYAIGAGGALSLVSTVGTLGMSSVIVDPTGKYAYALNIMGNAILQYAIGANGALTPLAPSVAPGMGSSLALIYGTAPVQAVPQYAYVAHMNENTIWQYTIGPGGGLTLMGASMVAAASAPVGIAVDPTGQYAYVANSGSNTVSQYTIGAGGGLTLMAVSSVAAGSQPSSVAVDPAGRYVYVPNYGDKTVSQYTIGAGGALTPMAASAVAATGLPQFMAIDPSGRYAYVETGGSVSQYTIVPGNGSLVPMATPTVAAGSNAQGIAVDPSGQYLYVANVMYATAYSGAILQYAIGAGGALAPMVTPSVAVTSPVALAVEPSGNYLYATTAATSTVAQFAIGAGGGLASVASVAAGSSPERIAIDPSGKYVYATNYLGNTVSQYTIGTGGTLAPMATPSVAAGTNPTTIVTTGTWQ